MTISVSDDAEQRFRQAVKQELGEGKGKLGKAVEEAVSKWVEDNEQRKLREEALAILRKGLYTLPKNYKFRREEAYEDRTRKITGAY